MRRKRGLRFPKALRSAYLVGIDLRDAYLHYVDFAHANLTDADLGGVDGGGANFGAAVLLGASLEGADLSVASFHQADLRDAVLSGACLGSAELGGANLVGARLEGADLRKANLRGADLTRADLTGATLRHADLTDANLAGIVGLDPSGARGVATEEEEAAHWRAICHAIAASPGGLDMEIWHSRCGTAHCLAGWLQAVCGGEAMADLDASIAGSMLAPRHAGLFFADEDAVRAEIEAVVASTSAPDEVPVWSGYTRELSRMG